MDFETRNYRFDTQMCDLWQILENNLTSRIMVMINWDKAYEMSTTVPRS